MEVHLHEDERDHLDSIKGLPSEPREVLISRNKQGTLKGLHMTPYRKVVYVSSSCINNFDAVQAEAQVVERVLREGEWLEVPAHGAHGFFCLDDSLVIYLFEERVPPLQRPRDLLEVARVRLRPQVPGNLCVLHPEDAWPHLERKRRGHLAGLVPRGRRHCSTLSRISNTASYWTPHPVAAARQAVGRGGGRAQRHGLLRLSPNDGTGPRHAGPGRPPPRGGRPDGGARTLPVRWCRTSSHSCRG